MDTTTAETGKPEPIEVGCQECGKIIGRYIGPIGYQEPVRSRYWKRADGTSPAHGSSTAGKCPHCNREINELITVMHAIAAKLAQITAAETLAEEPPNDAEVKAAEVPPILHAVNGDDNDLASDCCS